MKDCLSLSHPIFVFQRHKIVTTKKIFFFEGTRGDACNAVVFDSAFWNVLISERMLSINGEIAVDFSWAWVVRGQKMKNGNKYFIRRKFSLLSICY
jgi:hypothetical protein